MSNIVGRKGIVRISEELLNEMYTNGNLRQAVFSNLVIIRAEFHYISGILEYHCVSPLFDELTIPGVVIPVYTLNTTREKDGKYVISAQKEQYSC